MTLKRKRSSPASSSPGTRSDISTCSPIPSFYQQSKPIEPLHQKPNWSFPTYEDDHDPTRNYFNSRTRKRHRDNRPDEEEVYANTLNKLFTAQRDRPGASPILSNTVGNAIPTTPPTEFDLDSATTLPAQKSTLHAFWRIPTSIARPAQSHSVEARQDHSGGDDDDIDMISQPSRDVGVRGKGEGSLLSYWGATNHGHDVMDMDGGGDGRRHG